MAGLHQGFHRTRQQADAVIRSRLVRMVVEKTVARTQVLHGFPGIPRNVRDASFVSGAILPPFVSGATLMLTCFMSPDLRGQNDGHHDEDHAESPPRFPGGAVLGDQPPWRLYHPA